MGRLCATRNRGSGWYAIPPHGRGHRLFSEIEIGKRCIPKIVKPRPRYLIASNSDYIANPNGRFNGGGQRDDYSKKESRTDAGLWILCGAVTIASRFWRATPHFGQK